MSPADASLAPLAQRLTDGVALRAQLAIRVADCVIAVRTNSPALADHLRSYFRVLLADPDAPAEIDVAAIEAPPLEPDEPLTAYPPGPGKTKIKDEFFNFHDGRLVRKRLTRMAFLFGHDTAIAFGPCLQHANQVVNFINNRFIQRQLDDGCLLCHASAVALEGRGVMIAGVSGRGKSTLALHLLSSGFDYVSNDRVLLRPGSPPSILGVPKFPRVNPGTILNNPAIERIIPADERAQYQDLPRDELWRLERKFDVDVPAFFGDERFQLSAKLAGAVILTWEFGGGAARVEPADFAQRPHLLDALIKHPGVHYYRPAGDAPDPVLADYVAALAPAEGIVLAGGVDFDRAVDACRRVIADANGPADR